jgi:hypothetical protein
MSDSSCLVVTGVESASFCWPRSARKNTLSTADASGDSSGRTYLATATTTTTATGESPQTFVALNQTKRAHHAKWVCKLTSAEWQKNKSITQTRGSALPIAALFRNSLSSVRNVLAQQLWRDWVAVVDAGTLQSIPQLSASGTCTSSAVARRGHFGSCPALHEQLAPVGSLSGRQSATTTTAAAATSATAYTAATAAVATSTRGWPAVQRHDVLREELVVVGGRRVHQDEDQVEARQQWCAHLKVLEDLFDVGEGDQSIRKKAPNAQAQAFDE